MGDYSKELLGELARRFEWHSTHIYGSKAPENASPLYAYLSMRVAQDRDMLQLVTGADLAQQVSNLLFGAVHYLLLGGLRHPVVAFYRSLTQNPKPPELAYPDFRDFCLRHSGEIKNMVATRRVQTNEVQRAACLLPAFETVSRLAGRQPLALLEIGASAGFLLRWDHYAYDYGSAGQIGEETAPVRLECLPQGIRRLPVPTHFPEVVFRQGVDLMPIDVNDPSQMRWLQALIWPEHTDRAERMQQAAAVAHRYPVEIRTGDAADLLPQMLDAVPFDTALCIYHSYTLNQCARVVRERILERIATISRYRDLYRISLEWYSGQEQPHLEVCSYVSGEMTTTLLAYCESHGRHINWLKANHI
jgi:hypothetical protein